jgi:hypothetical protein
VVRSDGTVGNYRGGPAAKRALLDLEVRIDQSGREEYGLPNPLGPSRK